MALIRVHRRPAVFLPFQQDGDVIEAGADFHLIVRRIGSGSLTIC
jgi:hypothetical protein